MEDNHFASVGGIVLRGDAVLLVRHTYGGAAGMLLNPSGFVQQGEMPYDALRREIMEETGVSIAPRELLAVRCSVKDWWMVFQADYIEGEPRSDHAENNEALFMPCVEALARTDVTDATKALIRLAQKNAGIGINTDYALLPSSQGRIMFSL